MRVILKRKPFQLTIKPAYLRNLFVTICKFGTDESALFLFVAFLPSLGTEDHALLSFLNFLAGSATKKKTLSFLTKRLFSKRLLLSSI